MTLAADTETLSTPFRSPHNSAQGSKGSIHDDATASRLGFRGGTVAGSLHMDQLPPLLVQLYGDKWWAEGNLSAYFRKATVDREEVRAFAKAGEPHARLWMEDREGNLIAEASASCAGDDTDTTVQNLLAGQSKSDPSGLKILSGVRVGQTVEGIECSVSQEALTRRLNDITERLPVYEGEKAILPPSMCVHLYRGHVQEKLYRTDGGAVGLFGAIELQSMGEAMRADTLYITRAEVVALTESPKTENVWYRATAADPKTGKDVNSMLMYLRYMKGSSKHYQ